jgi:hypothetical protein
VSKPAYKDSFRMRKRDPLLGFVRWIVTARYTLVTSRGRVECVRMRAVVSNTFSIHVSVEYLAKHFVKMSENT